MRTNCFLVSLLLLTGFPRASVRAVDPQGGADELLQLYNSLLVGLGTAAGEAQWRASTDVSPEHDGERVGAMKAFSMFVGDRAIIERTRVLLEQLRSKKGELSGTERLARRQLERILLAAAEAPGTIPVVVAARVETESRQSSIQDGFQFVLDGKPVSANDIDEVLSKSRDLEERKRAWLASKEIGKPLRTGIIELRRLRNAVAREMGHSSFHALQVADYDMTVGEMDELLAGFLRDTRPLYLQLHSWTKHELARRYGAPIPEKTIPAHWINNRWSQNWTGLVEAADLDPHFEGREPRWIVEQAEKFYVSLGFPPLPESFWTLSDLFPVPPGETRKKNSHASAWHVDLNSDVRSLMSVQANERWFGTAHHELGHIYYYMSYTRPEVPPILRAGANRAFHEGIGELIAIASQQTPYLRQVGILPPGKVIDTIPFLLNEALAGSIPFIAWSCGVMARWERDFYEGELPASELNARWWSHVREAQGIEPPGPRSAEHCDPATKTHINDDPAQYYDYAIATVLKYQLHDHIARKILKQDPAECNYMGSAAAGEWLRSILRQGATRPWREVLREATGEDLSTRAMVERFRPLEEWLRKETTGRRLGWDS
ncbi:MAG TPA: M2 family metallopeptidase [Planctomycetota bacterium]|nr:M2 family metallopeptidase [Planctomycetota bacterium]